MTDTTVLLMLALKNNWSLSGTGMTGSDIVFTTNWYSENIVVPQISITQSSDINEPIEIGLTPMNAIMSQYDINIWVRPSSDSNTNMGVTKNINYNLRKEVKKIIKNIGNIGTDSEPEFVHFVGWRSLPDMSVRYVLFRTNIVVRTYKYRDKNDSV